MKDYFEMKTFITVLIALVLFKVIDVMFLDKTVAKIAKKESLENVDDEDEDDNE